MSDNEPQQNDLNYRDEQPQNELLDDLIDKQELQVRRFTNNYILQDFLIYVTKTFESLKEETQKAANHPQADLQQQQKNLLTAQALLKYNETQLYLILSMCDQTETQKQDLPLYPPVLTPQLPLPPAPSNGQQALPENPPNLNMNPNLCIQSNHLINIKLEQCLNDLKKLYNEQCMVAAIQQKYGLDPALFQQICNYLSMVSANQISLNQINSNLAVPTPNLALYGTGNVLQNAMAPPTVEQMNNVNLMPQQHMHSNIPNMGFLDHIQQQQQHCLPQDVYGLPPANVLQNVTPSPVSFFQNEVASSAPVVQLSNVNNSAVNAAITASGSASNSGIGNHSFAMEQIQTQQEPNTNDVIATVIAESQRNDNCIPESVLRSIPYDILVAFVQNGLNNNGTASTVQTAPDQLAVSAAPVQEIPAEQFQNQSSMNPNSNNFKRESSVIPIESDFSIARTELDNPIQRKLPKKHAKHVMTVAPVQRSPSVIIIEDVSVPPVQQIEPVASIEQAVPMSPIERTASVLVVPNDVAMSPVQQEGLMPPIQQNDVSASSIQEDMFASSIRFKKSTLPVCDDVLVRQSQQNVPLASLEQKCTQKATSTLTPVVKVIPQQPSMISEDATSAILNQNIASTTPIQCDVTDNSVREGILGSIHDNLSVMSIQDTVPTTLIPRVRSPVPRIVIQTGRSALSIQHKSSVQEDVYMTSDEEMLSETSPNTHSRAQTPMRLRLSVRSRPKSYQFETASTTFSNSRLMTPFLPSESISQLQQFPEVSESQEPGNRRFIVRSENNKLTINKNLLRKMLSQSRYEFFESPLKTHCSPKFEPSICKNLKSLISANSSKPQHESFELPHLPLLNSKKQLPLLDYPHMSMHSCRLLNFIVSSVCLTKLDLLSIWEDPFKLLPDYKTFGLVPRYLTEEQSERLFILMGGYDETLGYSRKRNYTPSKKRKRKRKSFF